MKAACRSSQALTSRVTDLTCSHREQCNWTGTACLQRDRQGWRLPASAGYEALSTPGAGADPERKSRAVYHRQAHGPVIGSQQVTL